MVTYISRFARLPGGARDLKIQNTKNSCDCVSSKHSKYKEQLRLCKLKTILGNNKTARVTTLLHTTSKTTSKNKIFSTWQQTRALWGYIPCCAKSRSGSIISTTKISTLKSPQRWNLEPDLWNGKKNHILPRGVGGQKLFKIVWYVQEACSPILGVGAKEVAQNCTMKAISKFEGRGSVDNDDNMAREKEKRF